MKKFITIALTAILSFNAFADAPAYDRHSQFGGWVDEDGDCLDTRDEVLIRDSLVPAIVENCDVVSGIWADPYTGEVFNSPKKLDIEHVVALKEAWVSGAHQWTYEQRSQFANDLSNDYHLIAVSASSNRSKGNKDPSDWVPPNLAFLEEYLQYWVAIKSEWNLDYDQEEKEAIEKLHAIAKKTRISMKVNDDGDLEYLYKALKD